MVPTAALSGARHKYSEQKGCMPWNKQAATHYFAQLGFPEKGRTIKGLVAPK